MVSTFSKSNGDLKGSGGGGGHLRKGLLSTSNKSHYQKFIPSDIDEDEWAEIARY